MDDLDIFSAALPPALLGRAYRATHEFAWTRADALEAIGWLERAGVIILGVDVWIPRPGRGPIVSGLFVYDWSSERSERDRHDWPRTAAEFVRTFEWDPTDPRRACEPWFNLCVDTPPRVSRATAFGPGLNRGVARWRSRPRDEQAADGREAAGVERRVSLRPQRESAADMGPGARPRQACWSTITAAPAPGWGSQPKTAAVRTPAAAGGA